MKPIILASDSPRRSDLLGECGIKFTRVSHRYDESAQDYIHPCSYVKKLALGKAESVAGLDEYSDSLVLGVDTIVVHKGTILGKPASRSEAEQYIRRLSGKKHKVLTGIALVHKKKGICRVKAAVSQVTFEKIDPNFMQFYLDNNHWVGYAGGYAIQGIFSLVIKKIKGSYTNIVGLPVELLYKQLKKIRYFIF